MSKPQPNNQTEHDQESLNRLCRDWVRELCARLDCTQKAFAPRVNLTETALSNRMSNRADWDNTDMYRLAGSVSGITRDQFDRGPWDGCDWSPTT